MTCCELLYKKQMDSRSLGLHSINYMGIYMHSRIRVSLLKIRSHAVARIADRTASQQTIASQAVLAFTLHVRTTLQQVWMGGWLGFNGILSTQVAAISCLNKFSLLVRPMSCTKEIMRLG